jgi:hypothetical protein
LSSTIILHQLVIVMWGGDVIQDIWYTMKADPEDVALFLLLFIGLVVLFRFILETSVTPYVLVLLAIIALF